MVLADAFNIHSTVNSDTHAKIIKNDSLNLTVNQSLMKLGFFFVIPCIKEPFAKIWQKEIKADATSIHWKEVMTKSK